MAEIRPVSDLRNNFADISRAVRQNEEGVILTKNGYPDMVVLSYEANDRRKLENEIYLKLMEAELEARATTERFSHKDVFSELYSLLRNKGNGHEV